LRLASRTAIVSGAGRGLGWAIAELYAREGAPVVIASRSAEGCGIRSLLSLDDNNGNSETKED
jgi:NAD(P)-dependent dehydrogenase (short-subunit alcohol dehydrogenase family)